MKIIKNTMTEPIKITCPVCKSVLEYTHEDIRREERSNMFFPVGEKFVIRYLICPVCKSTIELGAKVVLKEEEND